MSFIYHYHATIQTSIAEIIHIDGILTCDEPIDSMDRYDKIKKQVAGDDYDHEKLTIASLSLLHS